MAVPSIRSGLLAAAVAGAAALVLPGIATGAAPTYQVVDAGPAVPGLSTADEIAGELLAPGVVLAAPATINGTTNAATYAAALPAFGRFSSGDADIGIPGGLVIGANARASSYGAGPVDDVIAADRDDADLFNVVDAAGLCNSPTVAACTNNATSIEFAVTPTARYLKFEYALAITERGTWNSVGQTWSGDVFTFPDGFALFVGGRQVAANCAVVPRTSTYVTMQTAGVVAPAGTGDNRSTALANLAARAADEASPPVTPAGFAFSTENPQWAVRFMTVPLTCVADVNAALLAAAPAELKIVVADINDSLIPPAVFLQGNSIRFSDNATPSPAPDPAPSPPAEPPAAGPVPAPTPVTPAPGSAPPPVTPLGPPSLRRPRAGDARRDVVLIHRLQFDAVGRYTFVYLSAATGRRIAQLPGSTIGPRTLGGRFSAPVLRNRTAGRRLVLASRFDPRTFPRTAGGVRLRIVLKTPDGRLSEVTMDGAGRLG